MQRTIMYIRNTNYYYHMIATDHGMTLRMQHDLNDIHSNSLHDHAVLY